MFVAKSGVFAISGTRGRLHGHPGGNVVTVTVVVTVSVVILSIVVVLTDPVAARALPVAESMSATAGGVTAAKRPAFSRNKRRPASFAGLFFSSSATILPPGMVNRFHPIHIILARQGRYPQLAALLAPRQCRARSVSDHPCQMVVIGTKTKNPRYLHNRSA